MHADREAARARKFSVSATVARVPSDKPRDRGCHGGAAHLQGADRQPRRDRVPRDAHGQSDGHRDGRRLLQPRPPRTPREVCRRGPLPGRHHLCRELPARRRGDRGGARQRRAGDPSGLRLPLRERRLRRRGQGRGPHFHRPARAGDARHGLEGRGQGADGGGGRAAAPRVPRRRPELGHPAQRGEQVRPRRGPPCAAQGRARRRRQGHAHRARRV